jgi:septum formation protein
MLILASQSNIRRQLLAAAGIKFQTETSPLDERKLQTELAHCSPPTLAQSLANAKAVAVSQIHEDTVVIGVDQTLSFEGQILHKSQSRSEALTTLQKLRGKSHELHTAYSIVKNQKNVAQHCQQSNITMRWYSDIFLEDYLQEEQNSVLQSVGCYQLEAKGIQLMSDLDGDYFSILGLPLLPLLHHLRELGEIPT